MAEHKTILERRFVPKGSIIIEEGESGAMAYLIQSGKVVVYTSDDGKRSNIATLSSGQIVGETALIFDGKRTASVEAVEDCNLIIITRQSLEQKLAKSDATVRAIVEMLSRRVVSSNNTLLGRQDQPEDLTLLARNIYQNIVLALSGDQQKEFQSEVLPALNNLLEKIQAFDNSYK